MKNYYRECRERAGLSQEQAMELLDIGIRSLTDFESGKAIPPDRVAERMVEVYHSKTLGLVHLRNRYDIAMQCISESFIAEMEAKEIEAKKEGKTMKTEKLLYEVTYQPKTTDTDWVYSENVVKAENREDIIKFYEEKNQKVINISICHQSLEEIQRKGKRVIEIESTEETAKEIEEKKEDTTRKAEAAEEETKTEETEEYAATKFEVGKKYYCCSIVSDKTYQFEVVKRTKKTVTIKDSDGKIKRRKVDTINNGEILYPNGKYSMCLVLGSNELVEEKEEMEIKEEAVEEEITQEAITEKITEEITQMKVTSNKEQKIKEYLKNKINDSWYYHARMDYGVDGEFIDAKIKDSNLIIVWREEDNVYTGVIGYYEDYNCEQLYDIWSEGNINIIECITQQSNPKKEEKEKVEVVGNVIYCDFGKAV